MEWKHFLFFFLCVCVCVVRPAKGSPPSKLAYLWGLRRYFWETRSLRATPGSQNSSNVTDLRHPWQLGLLVEAIQGHSHRWAVFFFLCVCVCVRPLAFSITFHSREVLVVVGEKIIFHHTLEKKTARRTHRDVWPPLRPPAENTFAANGPLRWFFFIFNCLGFFLLFFGFFKNLPETENILTVRSFMLWLFTFGERPRRTASARHHNLRVQSRGWGPSLFSLWHWFTRPSL